MNRSKHLTFILVFSLLLMEILQGQHSSVNETGYLRGRAHLANSTSILPGIRVSLRSITNGIYFTTNTDSSGYFVFNNLEIGSYSLVVAFDGYQDYQSAVSVDDCKSCIMDIFLRPALEPSLPLKDKSKFISLQNLRNVVSKKSMKAYLKAEEYGKQGKEEEALKLLRKAVELSPAFAEAHGEIGNLYLRRGNKEAASASYEKAISLGSTDAKTHLNLGIIYYEKNENPKAIQLLQKTITIDPRSAVASLYLGGACYRSQLYSQAIAHLKKALLLDPQKATQAHLQLANVYSKQRLYSEAIEELEKYLAENPETPSKEAIKTNVNALEKARVLQGGRDGENVLETLSE